MNTYFINENRFITCRDVNCRTLLPSLAGEFYGRLKQNTDLCFNISHSRIGMLCHLWSAGEFNQRRIAFIGAIEIKWGRIIRSVCIIQLQDCKQDPPISSFIKIINCIWNLFTARTTILQHYVFSCHKLMLLYYSSHSSPFPSITTTTTTTTTTTAHFLISTFIIRPTVSPVSDILYIQQQQGFPKSCLLMVFLVLFVFSDSK